MMGTIYRIGTRSIDATRTTPEAPGAAVLHASDGDRRVRRVRDGSVVARLVAAARRRDSVRRAHLHEPDPRPSRLPLEHGGALRGQAPAVRDGAGGRAVDHQRRRPARAALLDVSRRAITYGINKPADVAPGPLSSSLEGLQFDVRLPHVVHVRLASGRPAQRLQHPGGRGDRVVARHSDRGHRKGHPPAAGCSRRFELASSRDDDVTVIVDYAHTDDALRNLRDARMAAAARRLITVFGAGGDRAIARSGR